MRSDAHFGARDGHLMASDSNHDVMMGGLTGMRDCRPVMGQAPRCGVPGLTAGTELQPCRWTDGDETVQDALRDSSTQGSRVRGRRNLCSSEFIAAAAKDSSSLWMYEYIDTVVILG
jgi:hypothetical protein